MFYLAGCDYQLGRESDSLCQPMTTCFRMSGVDIERYKREEMVGSLCNHSLARTLDTSIICLNLACSINLCRFDLQKGILWQEVISPVRGSDFYIFALCIHAKL